MPRISEGRKRAVGSRKRYCANTLIGSAFTVPISPTPAMPPVPVSECLKPKPIGTSTDQLSVIMRAIESVGCVSEPTSTVVPGGAGGESVPLEVLGEMLVTPALNIQVPADWACAPSEAAARTAAPARRKRVLLLFMVFLPWVQIQPARASAREIEEA